MMEHNPDSRPAADATDAVPVVPEDVGNTPSLYDPADYRWVPVRRRPRYDGWTPEKQRHFIEVLADSGSVALAAKAVGMTRETAYRLRRAPGAEAFARAWDAARHHAGGLLEDIAFERAIEGVEHNVYDENGAVVCTRRSYNDRLLTFLLTRLKPERYGKDAPERPAKPPVAVDAVLRDMEPRLPAPPETMLDAATLAHELDLADVSDGALPHFLTEIRPPKSKARLAQEEAARGAAAWAKFEAKEPLTADEEKDLFRYLDPVGMSERGRKRFR